MLRYLIRYLPTLSAYAVLTTPYILAISALYLRGMRCPVLTQAFQIHDGTRPAMRGTELGVMVGPMQLSPAGAIHCVLCVFKCLKNQGEVWDLDLQ
eukprot:2877234-Rhodomonas_salina.3